MGSVLAVRLMMGLCSGVITLFDKGEFNMLRKSGAYCLSADC